MSVGEQLLLMTKDESSPRSFVETATAEELGIDLEDEPFRDDVPQVPQPVLDAIENLFENQNTATEQEIRDALKF